MTLLEQAELLWSEIERQSDGRWPVDISSGARTVGLVDMEIDFIELAAALRTRSTQEGDKG